MRNIDMIRQVSDAAAGRWPDVLSLMGIDVPALPRAQVACPACGGKDRFRFDDDGRGAHFCNNCGAGDGLELVKKVNSCDATRAAQLVADALGMNVQDIRNSTSQGGARQQKDQAERRAALAQQQAQEQAARAARFSSRLAALTAQAQPGESAYLAGKGLPGFTYPILPDGALVLTLVNESGATAAAQTITADGEKRLLTGSAKKGAYHVINPVKSPQTVIIGEGLATVLSVHLMRPDALAVVAIDAGNLLPVAQVMRQHYPHAQIVIAADNDWHVPGETDDRGKLKVNTGHISAEKAAQAVAGWVALPAGEFKADWDDLRQHDGIAQTRAAFTKSLYQPQGEDVFVSPEVTVTDSASQKRNAQKPYVDSRRNGLYWVEPKEKGGEIAEVESLLCSALKVVGVGIDDNKTRYLVLRWQAMGAKEETTQAIPLADIGEREGWRTLKAGGLYVTTKSGLRATLADWLQSQAHKGEIWRIAQATGWQCGAYLMPDGDIIGTPEIPVLFNGRSSAASGYTTSGTAESWRDSVANLANGNYSMMTGVAAALAAPLIGLAGADGFGIHFYEQSSAGKTTTANVAASLYGNPDVLRLTWYGTALGLANEAAAHNDALMPLDEIGQGADPVEVYKSAYALFNGTGKLQGAKEGGNRELKRWRTVAISTGEVDLETFIAGAGRKAKAGQLVRLLNIPLSKAIRFHGHESGKHHADALKDAYQSHHGAAGRAWVQWLADHQQETVKAVREAEARWRGIIPADYGEQVHRVGARFAILEAALMAGRVITGWDEQTCRDAIQYSFNAWIREFGTGNKDHQQIIEQTEAFLNAHGLSRFAPFPYDPGSLPIANLAGYRQKGGHEADPVVFYTFPAAFEKEIAQGFNAKMFAEVLKNAGMLTPPNTGRGYQRKSPRIDGRQINVYVIQYQPEGC
ncbi:MAG TPA: DNA primase [Leclercia adecarboxylata]|jgi:putative DNA primase/helicase|nr:DNA primase [Leclercia adecarboxylata]HCQ07955.1 DNA primase [Leclercia adecarboxylata]